LALLSFGTSLASMGAMLKICNDLVTGSEAAYLAFRLACRDTLERMLLSEQAGSEGDAPYGFLTEVPFLRNVPPQVQIELLAATWNRLTQADAVPGSIVDESVIYAACETAARLIAADPATAERLVADGPRPVSLPPPSAAVQQIHAVHLDLSNEGNFLLISQFQDIPPTEARILKAKFGLPEPACEAMFDVLAMWHASPEFASNAAGLLSAREIPRAAALLTSAARGRRRAGSPELASE
jgi:hypothetical protein